MSKEDVSKVYDMLIQTPEKTDKIKKKKVKKEAKKDERKSMTIRIDLEKYAEIEAAAKAAGETINDFVVSHIFINPPQVGGRPPKFDNSKINEVSKLKKEGKTQFKIAVETGMSLSTVQRILKRQQL